jgi:hypothetical protein
MVPDSDKDIFLKSALKNSIIKSNEFNSEAIYITETRSSPVSYDIFQNILADKVLLQSAINNMSVSMGLTNTSDISVYDKGSLRSPLTGFYVYSEAGAQSELSISLATKDTSNNTVSMFIVYLGRNGKFNQDTAKNIIDSLNIDSRKLKPYLDYQLPIKTGPIQLKAADLKTGSPQNDPDVMIKSRLVAARNTAEVYYSNSNSYAGFCTTAQSYKDIKQEMTQYQTYKYTLSCNDSKTAYAVSSDLMVGGYWCIDSTGYQGKVTAPNTQTYCSGQVAPIDTPQPTPTSAPNNSTNIIRIPTAAPSPIPPQVPVSSVQSPLTITYPTAGAYMYMGQSYNIVWTNPPSQPINYSVYLENNADVGVSSLYLGSVSSSQQTFAFKVPSNVQPGSQYQIYLMYASNGNVVASSHVFSIASQ